MSQSKNGCLYLIFTLVLINMILSSALAITMVYMYNTGEPEAKRVSNEFIIDRLNEIRDNKQHDELIKDISQQFTLIMEDAAPELSKKNNSCSCCWNYSL